ncbi:DUF3397 domain-containing protein [Paraliobacillus sp. JSM ZJ581]|uniref:DUF3397 domain-containing protein n=1 Tax=Paraliobacillus sp. JSM ZJ581 TaxID=3342118 RepID=UPI0035A98C5C
MIQAFGIMLAMIVTFPWLATISLYIIIKLMYKNTKRALHLSVAYSTLLYIVSVMIMLQQLFNHSFFGLIIILLLSGLMCSIIIQWRLTDEIILKKAWRIFWRASFVFFLFCHLILSIIGIIITIINI